MRRPLPRAAAPRGVVESLVAAEGFVIEARRECRSEGAELELFEL